MKKQKAPAHSTLSSTSNTHRVGPGGAGVVEQITAGIVIKTVSGTAKGVKSDKLYPRNTKTRPGANLCKIDYVLLYTNDLVANTIVAISKMETTTTN